ncbi:buddy of Hmr 1 [Haematobia irritans]|uniref:buddy of Hmr 1 n=1 Tax=Haematobia irritans TaxID=7368 RepID=UPI003F501565
MATMAQSKNPKEMFVVNFKEIPETICVETRFITRAGANQKKDQMLFYMSIKQGQIELSKYEVPVAAGANASPQIPTLPPVRNKHHTAPVNIRPKQMPVPSIMANAPPQYGSLPPTAPLVSFTQQPLGFSMSSPYNVRILPESSNIVNTLPVTMPPVNLSMANPITQNMNFTPTPVMISPSVYRKDSENMTEQIVSLTHREQQTDVSISGLVSIAIQCNRDDEFDEEIINESGTTNSEDNGKSEEELKEEFIKYVNENSTEYENHFRECLICGEVCKKLKSFYGHMAVHRGPKVLCYICGLSLDHESILKTHQCSNSNRSERSLLRCPYKKCTVIALSRLELYDHINEHNKFRTHKCTACRKAFCTTQEFLRHLLLRGNCYTEAKRNRTNLYGLSAKKDRKCRVRVFTLHTHAKKTAMVKRNLAGSRSCRKDLCEICFRSFRSKYIFKRHIKKCSDIKLKKKLANREKQIIEPTNVVTPNCNGKTIGNNL